MQRRQQWLPVGECKGHCYTLFIIVFVIIIIIINVSSS